MASSEGLRIMLVTSSSGAVDAQTVTHAKHFRRAGLRQSAHLDAVRNRRSHGLFTKDVISQLGKVLDSFNMLMILHGG